MPTRTARSLPTALSRNGSTARPPTTYSKKVRRRCHRRLPHRLLLVKGVVRVATYQSGNVRKVTQNSRTAARNSAASRQCPKCGRKSALRHYSDDLMFGTACRWEDCGYERMTMR